MFVYVPVPVPVPVPVRMRMPVPVAVPVSSALRASAGQDHDPFLCMYVCHICMYMSSCRVLPCVVVCVAVCCNVM